MDYSIFGSVPVSKKRRTNFNESHSVSGTFPLSKMCPVCFIDSIPGSSWNINVYNLTKLETLIAPAMQRVNASILWFKMPKRLVFKHFKNWYSGGTDGDDVHQKPHVLLSEIGAFIVDNFNESDLSYFTNLWFGPGSLWNYLGLPVPLDYNPSSGVWSVSSVINWSNDADDGSDFIDIMPFMAYQYLYDTMFRDQTLSDPIFVDSEEGNFTINIGRKYIIQASPSNRRYYIGPQAGSPHYTYEFYTSGKDLSEGGKVSPADFLCLLDLFNRAWQKDYFTSALPTPQRGPEVKLSLMDDDAPVSGENADWSVTARNMTDQSSVTAGTPLTTARELDDEFGNKTPLVLDGQDGIGDYSFDTGFNVQGLKADLSNLTPITITALRNLFKLQQFLEKNNVAGGRYIESILAHWGERVPDYTVQRPQFVRATSLPVQIMEVTATANSSGVNSLVGDQAGRARTQGNLGFVHMYTQEPSFIFGLYCVTAPPAYAGQGIPRIFQHKTRFDEPWSEFQHIGEQAVKARELYFNFTDMSQNDEDFGYQQRYSEYKCMPDRVVGDFQTSLAFWHMARMFNGVPRLNSDFVTQNLDPRIFAVQNNRPVTADFFFDIKAKIKLSKYSTPKLT